MLVTEGALSPGTVYRVYVESLRRNGDELFERTVPHLAFPYRVIIPCPSILLRRRLPRPLPCLPPTVGSLIETPFRRELDAQASWRGENFAGHKVSQPSPTQFASATSGGRRVRDHRRRELFSKIYWVISTRTEPSPRPGRRVASFRVA